MRPEDAICLHNYLHLISITLLFYDHLLTLPAEIDRIWKRLRAPGSWLFLLNRYLAFVGAIFITFFNFMGLSPEGCIRYSASRQALIVLTAFIVSYILVLRTYALWNRSKRVLYFLLSFGFILIALSAWALSIQNSGSKSGTHTSGDQGCHVATTSTQAHHIVVPWICLVVFDTSIFGLTTARAYTITASRSRASSMGFRHVRALFRETSALDVGAVVWRDGALYYVVMVFINLVNVVTFYTAPPLLKGALSTPSSAFLALLCSRLMLNLHESSSASASARPLRTHTTGDGQDTATRNAAFTSQFELGAELPIGADITSSQTTDWPKQAYHGRSISGRTLGDAEEDWEMECVGKRGRDTH